MRRCCGARLIGWKSSPAWISRRAQRRGRRGTHRRAPKAPAQLLATLHLSARDRFRLILQRIDVEREIAAVDASDDTRLVGSLLFTHERTLTRRIYAGVSWARATSLGLAQRETAEVFVKLQWGMSTGRDIKW